MSGIVVIGSLNMDLVVKTPRAPQAGETLAGTHFEMIPGGKGANQAVAAAKMGADVAMIGRVGGDAFGAALRGNLQTQGVDVNAVSTDASTSSGTALIIVEESGENRIVIIAGANGAVDRAQIDALRPMLAEAQLLILQCEIPLDTVEYVLRYAAESGVPTLFNAAPAYPAAAALLPLATYLIVNESEAAALSGVTVSDPDSAQTAAQQLRQQGSQIVVITLGKQGVVLLDAAQKLHLPAWPVEVVDTTAAGDAFIGGFAAALVQSLPLREALRWGSAAGALAVTRFGAQPSLPTLDEVQAFLRVRS
jgi:ribokinase